MRNKQPIHYFVKKKNSLLHFENPTLVILEYNSLHPRYPLPRYPLPRYPLSELHVCIPHSFKLILLFGYLSSLEEGLAEFHAAMAGYHHDDDSNAPSIQQDLDFDSSEEMDDKPNAIITGR